MKNNKAESLSAFQRIKNIFRISGLDKNKPVAYKLTLAMEKLYKIFDAINGLRFVKNKLPALLHISGISGKQCTYRLFNGLFLDVPGEKRDRTAILSVYDIYNNTSQYAINSSEYKTIMDLGANIGVYSLYAAKQCPKAKVYSFEPDAGSFAQLKNNISINSYKDRIIPFEIAITNDVGKKTFYKDNISTRRNSILCKIKDEDVIKTTVNSSNLKTIFAKMKIGKVDMLKMDIEGSEYEVLYNCPKNILKKIDRMLIECHDNDFTGLNKEYTKKNVEKFLENNGFKIIRNDEMLILCERSLSEN